jgi:hypothetical protein
MHLIQLRTLVLLLILWVVNSIEDDATVVASTTSFDQLRRQENDKNLRSNKHRHLSEVSIPKTPQVRAKQPYDCLMVFYLNWINDLL